MEGGLLLHHVVLQLRLERHLALTLLDGVRLSQWVQVLLSGEEAVAAVAAAEAEDQVINLANMKKAKPSFRVNSALFMSMFQRKFLLSGEPNE